MNNLEATSDTGTTTLLKTNIFWKKIWKFKMAYLFVLPALLLLAVFMVIPLFNAFKMSLYNWDGLLVPEYIGFENFRNLFLDESFWIAMKNNLLYTVITTFFTVVLGFLFAVAIDRRLKGWKVYKSSFFLPVMISMTVVGMLFGRIFEPTYGLLNSFIGLVGLDFLKLSWLGDPKLAIYSVMAVSIWQYTGFTMLLFLAAIEGIPMEIHEAATIDGVSGWQRITNIIFPTVKRVVFVVTMLQIIFSFKVFDIVWVMTNGGPGNASEVLGTLLYKSAFTSQKFGYASAIGIVMTAVVFTFSLIYLKSVNLGEVKKE